jgi:hydrogenase expression/formation protein HypE
MAHVLQRRGVKLVTGDTKVVERGAASGLYINMTAVGSPIPDVNVAAGNAQPRDAVIVSGTFGDHGLAIMNEREQLGLHSQVCSDVADLSGMLNALVREFSQRIHVLRDPTRGGVTTAVCDIASRSQIAVYLDEERLPVRSETRGACELLGLEPLNAANEGKALVICPNDIAESVVSFLKDYPQGKNAAKIGETISGTPGQVTLRTSIGAQRILLPPTGQEMPRIC